jgi:hypothetical protein
MLRSAITGRKCRILLAKLIFAIHLNTLSNGASFSRPGQKPCGSIKDKPEGRSSESLRWRKTQASSTTLRFSF